MGEKLIKGLREQVMEERQMREALNAGHATLEDAVCEADAAVDQRLADIENALCELDREGTE